MKPLVSILIPAYNAQEWIADTLRSALAQTWAKKEIIVVDDGSTDQTLALARRFECDVLSVATQPNQGAGAARNNAYTMCQGDYIQWLDADDLLAPNKLELQIAAAEQVGCRQTLYSSAWGQFLFRPYRARFNPTAIWCDLPPTVWLQRKMQHNLHMQTATWLVSRELSEAAGPWNVGLAVDDDGEYFCRVLLASKGVRFVPEARVYYRASGAGSVSYIGNSKAKLDAQWKSMQLHISYLRRIEDSTRTRAACVAYLNTWLIYFYPQRPELVAQAENMARDMGGELSLPTLSWKYSWIESLFGWNVAKKAQASLRRARWSFERARDKTLCRIDQCRPART